jgi:hypothetical protein
MNEKDYDKKFEEYLKEKGPNPGATFFGSWGWYAEMKKQFDRELRENNNKNIQ